MLEAKGNSKEAVSLLLGLSKERPNQAFDTALLLEQLGELAAAEEVYRKHTALSRTPRQLWHSPASWPAGIVLSKRSTSARQPGGPPRQAVAEAMVAMLYATTIDDAQCRLRAPLLEKELAKNPKDAPLLFHLGNVRTLQGDYEQAQPLYQESIDYDQTNSGPLINLAWLIAPRTAREPGHWNSSPEQSLSTARIRTCSTSRLSPTW